MKEYEFILKFNLPDGNIDPEQYVDPLYEAGCDDANIGIGQKGRIALNFVREGRSAIDAIFSAISDVKKAIPKAKLVEVTPDLVGFTDIAEIIGCSRQNIRQVFIANKSVFPSPVHEGSVALWHLTKVLRWFKDSGDYDIKDDLIEISSASMQVNLAAQMSDLDFSIQKKLSPLLN